MRINGSPLVHGKITQPRYRQLAGIFHALVPRKEASAESPSMSFSPETSSELQLSYSYNFIEFRIMARDHQLFIILQAGHYSCDSRVRLHAQRFLGLVYSLSLSRVLKVTENSFQYFSRLTVRWVIITSLYYLTPKTAKGVRDTLNV